MRESRGLRFCGKHVALHRKRESGRSPSAGGMEKSDRGLSALITKADRSAGIFDKSVPSASPTRVDPSQSCLDIRPDRVDRQVSCPVGVHSASMTRVALNRRSRNNSEWHFSKASFPFRVSCRILPGGAPEAVEGSCLVSAKRCGDGPRSSH
jgi:hypothetical protein